MQYYLYENEMILLFVLYYITEYPYYHNLLVTSLIIPLVEKILILFPM